MKACIRWDAHHVCVRYPTPDLPQLVLVSVPLAPRTLVSVFPEPTGPECGIQYGFKALITRVSLEVDGSELRTGLLRDGPHFHPTLRRTQMGVRLRAYVHLQDAEQYLLVSTYAISILSNSKFMQCLKLRHLKRHVSLFHRLFLHEVSLIVVKHETSIFVTSTV